MVRLALNFICKNESHIVERMLESVRPIVDLIVAVDTGSTDNTVSIIQAFGERYSIPVFVFERKFDNFSNSRNYALDKLSYVLSNLQWDSKQVWVFYIDCDEVMQIAPEFEKRDLNGDMYVAKVRSDGTFFNRQICFRFSNYFRWVGPIHEILVCEDKVIKPQMLDNICVMSESTGGSWKGNLEEKFMNYATLLCRYVEEGHNEFRWIYYAASSYAAAAEHCRVKDRKYQLELLAKEYYDRASVMNIPTQDEEISLLKNRSENRKELHLYWPETREMLLDAYSLDFRRAESVASIIEYYMQHRLWSTAYLFSYFSVQAYHQKSPYGPGVAETDERLYQWKLLMEYCLCCFQTERRKQAKAIRKSIRALTIFKSAYFTLSDLVYIKSKSPIFLQIRNFRARMRLN